MLEELELLELDELELLKEELELELDELELLTLEELLLPVSPQPFAKEEISVAESILLYTLTSSRLPWKKPVATSWRLPISTAFVTVLIPTGKLPDPLRTPSK